MVNEYFEIRESKIHHKGGFAIKHIPKGTLITRYVGHKITKEEGTRRLDATVEANKNDPEHKAATYIFELNDGYDIDGDVPENDAKYINHSCEPNCEVDIINDEIIFVTTRDIAPGEEITINYGYGLDEDFRKYVCRCGKPGCLGYMVNEDDMPRLRELLEKDRPQNL